MDKKVLEVLIFKANRSWNGENADVWIEKFAELIVEECLSLCENERDLQQIKEHFGVE
jgi:hypothetical protein